AIVLLEIYPKNRGVLMHRGTYTPMFIAALSTIARLWKEPKCPSIGEWIKKLWYIYKMEYLAMKTNEILPFATMWMGLDGIMLSELSQRKTEILCLHSYVEFK
ncbi:LORF2 protein, partial [Crocuta crocuta]